MSGISLPALFQRGISLPKSWFGPRAASSARRQTRPVRPGESAEAVSLVSSATTMIALVCLWVVLQALVLGGLSQSRQQTLLYNEFRQQLAAATAPVGQGTDPGSPVATLTIPRLHLQQVVVEGTASGDLLAGPGHRRDTVLPGQKGVSVLYGRGSTYGAPFADIADLQPGDEITSLIGQGRIAFKVLDVRRDGDPIPPITQAGGTRLTLATAEGHGAFAALRPGRTVYVDAVSAKGYDAPGGRTAALPASEQAMSGDPGALPMLALAGALLIGLAVAVTALRQRHPASLVWTLAAPLGIALAWFTTDQVMRLLPNLI